MATLVFVHAHPDDEASQTSGSMARAVAEGHQMCIRDRVMAVVLLWRPEGIFKKG